MDTKAFDYNLPSSAIAYFPPATRGKAKLLVLDHQTGEIEHKEYANLIDYLSPNDVIVINDTKVIRARLIATDKNNKQTEIFLLENHGELQTATYEVLYRGNLHPGDVLKIDAAEIKIININNTGTATISSTYDLYLLAETVGSVPLPPYIKRQANDEDAIRYQTVFAKHAGSVAAPTASLNLTDELLKTIENKGIQVAYITLHVGLGTFAPIRSEDLSAHKMHSEYFVIPAETIEIIRRAKKAGNKITAIGTTVTRALEYDYANILDNPKIETSRGEADIFIFPGYQFKVVDQLLTNYHAPKSTVLMLAAAFAGKQNLQRAYTEALSHDYKFLSYGDSMLII